VKEVAMMLVRMLKPELRVTTHATLCLVATLLASLAVGCGDANDSDDNASSGGAGSGGGVGTGGTGGGVFLTDGGTGGTSGGGDANVCAAKTATAELRPAYLAFAFDVSGSMGQLDYPWHDPVLKWEPVIAATEAFFAAPASTGISASLTFFPADTDRCLASMYTTPYVPMTALPSSDFEAAITAVTPQTQSDWGAGTPTLAVLQGTFEFLQGFAQTHPEGIYAVVLVTDGYPSGCDDNEISSVVAEVSSHAATIPTYVIGVANPPIPDAPDTVSDLHAIAAAGGTSQAFIIETGDPQSTKVDFAQVIDVIRGAAISCEITIPPAPEGQVFDRSKVTVLYSSGGNETALAYDPSCAKDNAWHYDDPADPKSVVLCTGTCDAITSDPDANILVQFGCEVVIDIK
jgi:hypothetical protein